MTWLLLSTMRCQGMIGQSASWTVIILRWKRVLWCRLPGKMLRLIHLSYLGFIFYELLEAEIRGVLGQTYYILLGKAPKIAGWYWYKWGTKTSGNPFPAQNAGENGEVGWRLPNRYTQSVYLTRTRRRQYYFNFEEEHGVQEKFVFLKKYGLHHAWLKYDEK